MNDDDIDNLPQPKDHATLVYVDNLNHGKLSKYLQTFNSYSYYFFIFVLDKQQTELKKSQRFLDDDGDYQDTSDLTDSIKEKNAKKLAKLISCQIEYFEKKPIKSINSRSSEDLVKLLSNSKDFLKDEMKEVIIQKRVTIKRRKLDEDSNEKHDLQSVTVDPANFINEINFWDKRSKATVYEYKEKKCIAYLREPITEFTKARNKNNWMESKIKTTKYHNSNMSLNVNKR